MISALTAGGMRGPVRPPNRILVEGMCHNPDLREPQSTCHCPKNPVAGLSFDDPRPGEILTTCNCGLVRVITCETHAGPHASGRAGGQTPAKRVQSGLFVPQRRRWVLSAGQSPLD